MGQERNYPLLPVTGPSRGVIPAMALKSRVLPFFGIKLCQQFAKNPKYEGMSVDVSENKRTKNVTLGLSVDVAENKGR
jgi:hypothetical protein